MGMDWSVFSWIQSYVVFPGVGDFKTGGSIPGQEILDCENPCFLGGKYTEDIRT